MNNTLPPDELGCIAIVGFTGRFPGARNVEEYWQNLRSGRETITFFEDQELAKAGIEARSLNDPHYVKAAGVLVEDPGLFDASFFGYSPREAEIIDPQQRLFLECAWEALESAGYDAETYEGAVGVFAGADINGYRLNLYSDPNIMALTDGFQLANGNEKDHLVTRVSYKLNLKGPSVSVNTACSTSLVAVHLACQSLLNGECDMALAGGVSIKVPHKRGYQAGGIFSPDGHCRAFDARAQGTVGGSGVGVVVLKRLEDALAGHDTICAVIRGSAINNDGSLKVGYTAPSVDGQAAVIAEALAMASIDPRTITYVETHGTGTLLGDPIEIAALTKAFQSDPRAKGFCAIGSVKTNIGHLDTAAGMAGLIKTILAFEHKLLPPSLHFEKPNPEIDFSNSPFFVNTALSEWKAKEVPLRAGVSSFGIGGTNAHVILEEAPTIESSSVSRTWQLLLVSAKTGSALESATAQLVDYLKDHPELNLADAAYTLQVGRRAFNHRRLAICRDLPDALNALETYDPKRVFTSADASKNPALAFLFPGQGSQYVNMGAGLYRNEPAFRVYVDACCEILEPYLELSLREVLYPKIDNDQSASRLRQTALTQPAIFVIEYALGRTLMDWGIKPEAMIGHSIGEYVAACLAGVFSLEDALGLVATRARWMDQQPAGAMLAVPLSEQEAEPLLGEKLSVAALNGLGLCVVSGPLDAIEQFERRLGEKGLTGRRVHTSHAFHSQMMEPVMKPLAEQLKKIDLHPPQIPYLSNVTGNWIATEEATDPKYWVKHLRQPVRFSQGLQELLKQPNRILLEVGPGQTLCSLAKQHAGKVRLPTTLSTMRRANDVQCDVACLLNTMGKLWLGGVNINWREFYAGERRRRVPLPTYPFERERFWVERSQGGSHGSKGLATLFKKPDVADWFYFSSWKQSVPPKNLRHSGFPDQKTTWLLFMDPCGLASEIAKQLDQQRQDVVLVAADRQFKRIAKARYTIDPHDADHYNLLIEELGKQKRSPSRVVHLWSVTSNGSASAWDTFDQSLDEGFYSLLFLARALGQHKGADGVQIDVVSNHLHNVDGTESIYPERAALLGPCKVLPQEYPNIVCRCIDIALKKQHDNLLADQIMAELFARSVEPVIAYRGKHRWCQTFEPVRVERNGKAPTLRKNGIYLITGGLGNIGLTLAEYLAQAVKAKLVLVGRSSFPAKEKWNEYVQNPVHRDGVGTKIRKVQALENMGAEVFIVNADVADQNQMAGALSQAIKHFGGVHGVVHAAGIVGPQSKFLAQETDREASVPHFRAKVGGLIVLDKIFHGRQLDFCLVISSLSSILGGVGFSAYAAANLSADAFVQNRREIDGLPWISVNYDGWNFKTAGLGAGSMESDLLPSEGAEVFGRALCLEPMQIVISTADLNARMRKWINPESRRQTELRDDKTMQSGEFHSRPDLSTAYGAPTNDTQRILADIWRDLLGFEEVGIHDNFFELGGDSLLGTRIISRVREAFHIELPLRLLLERPTIDHLAAFIFQEHAKTSEEMNTAGTLTIADREQGEL